jgi:hypothetical protein
MKSELEGEKKTGKGRKKLKNFRSFLLGLSQMRSTNGFRVMEKNKKNRKKLDKS